MTTYNGQQICFDRIKDRLREWASFHKDRNEGGFPSQVAFASERVQTSNRNTDSFQVREMPKHVKELDDIVEGLAPGFKQVIAFEYFDRRPQKTKAQILKIPREVFSKRLAWAYEQLDFAVFGNHITVGDLQVVEYSLSKGIREVLTRKDQKFTQG